MKSFVNGSAKRIFALFLAVVALFCTLSMNGTFNRTVFAETQDGIAPIADCPYALVKNAADLAVGDTIIIAAKEYDVAISTTQNKNNRGQATIKKNGDTVTFGSDVQIITLEEGKKEGTFAFNVGAEYLCAASSGSNYLRTEGTLSNNSSWTIEIATDETATIKAQGTYTRNVMQYNKSSSLFACYSSASQKAIVIYSITHTWGEPTTTATCTEAGIQTVKCTNCGKEKSTDVTALGHNWNDGEITTPAGCETEGTKTFTCQREGCGETRTEAIEATGHSWGDVTVTKPATCTEDGTQSATCTVCGTSDAAAVIEKLGHDWDEGTVTTDPTCTAVGVKTFTCQREGCGETKTEDIDMVDHVEVFDEARSTISTCTVAGQEIYKCENCEEYSRTEALPLLEHVYNEYGVCTGCNNSKAVYKKVTSAPADWSGEYLIVYDGEDGTLAFDGSLNKLDAVGDNQKVSIESDSIDAMNMSQYAFTIEKLEDGGYSVRSASGIYIGRSEKSNGIDESSTEAYVNQISLDAAGNAVIAAAGGTTLRFNDRSDQMRFRYYVSDTQPPVALYKYEKPLLENVATFEEKSYTEASFKLSYEGGALKTDEIGLRFGAKMDAELYEALLAKGGKVGIELTCNGKTVYREATETWKPVKATEEGVESEEGTLYWFSFVMGGFGTRYDMAIEAKVYVEFNGVKYYTGGANYSIDSLAEEMLQNYEAGTLTLTDEELEVVSKIAALWEAA